MDEICITKSDTQRTPMALTYIKCHHLTSAYRFIVPILNCGAIGRAHGEFFRDIRPAATMVEVSAILGYAFH